MLAPLQHVRAATIAALAALFFVLLALAVPAGLPELELGSGTNEGTSPVTQPAPRTSAVPADWTAGRLVSPMERLTGLAGVERPASLSAPAAGSR